MLIQTTIFLLLCLQIPAAVAAVGNNPKYANFDAYPNPQYEADLGRCNIQRRGFFCDPEAMINNSVFRSTLNAMVENFPNKTRNPFGKTECERKGVNLGLGLSYNFWNVLPTTESDEIAGAFANKWFSVERVRSNCSKDVMLMVVALEHDAGGLYFSLGINHTGNLPIDDQTFNFLWANARLSIHDYNYFGAFAAIIERLQHTIQHDIHTSAILAHSSAISALKEQHSSAISALQNQHSSAISALRNQHSSDIDDLKKQHSSDIVALKNQPKPPFGVSVWLCIDIAICCSLVMSIFTLIIYRALFERKKKTFDGPVSMRQLAKAELEGQFNSQEKKENE